MRDALGQAEHIVRRAGRLAPRDAGRGREVRTRRSSVRWFSWRDGFAGRRGRRWWVHIRWSIGSRHHVLFGLSTYKDDDDERCIDIGFWPFRWDIGLVVWPLSDDDICRIDAAVGASTTPTSGGPDDG